MIKKCKKHGDTEHFSLKEGVWERWRCRKCTAEGVTRHRKSKKRWCIEQLGGACIRCGYSKCIEALEFHHRNPSEKEFGFSKYQAVSYEKLTAELSKCDLLCANCHREIHAEGSVVSPVATGLVRDKECRL